jgi:ATP-dependent Clp protease ATP-binding subunit ClpA
MLLGVVRAGQGLEHDVLARAGLSVVATRSRIAPAIRVREPLDSSVVIPFSDVTTLVLRAARAEAERLAHARVGLAHVVLGILRARESVAASILRGRGIESDQVRARVSASLTEESA